ncbi:MAG: hypothetical protein E3K37_02475 [Candidatus Kuenenia sp.]|nr:hypothetical protein [Candidatus Kuenenia hertensis]
MIQEHPRYQKMVTHNGNEIEFVIFHKEYKLRSHAAKHFLHTYEWETGWIKIYREASLLDKYNLNEINELRTKVSDSLKEMNCPYIIASEMEVNDSCRVCNLFRKKCYLTGIEKLQSLYVELIRHSIEKVLQVPRYAEFVDFYCGQDILIGVREGPVIIRTSLLSEQKPVYNVMTSFVPLSFGIKVKFADIINDERINIKEKARRNHIEWYEEDTWRIAVHSSKENKVEKKITRTEKTAKEWIDAFYNFYDDKF